MSTGSGTVTVDVTLTETGYQYRETSNGTKGAVTFNPANGGQFKALEAGHFQFAFTATNFELANPPVTFPSPQPPFLKLDPDFTTKQFSVTNVNTGSVKNQQGSFDIVNAGGELVDPTVVNNPIPTPLPPHGRG